MRVSHGIGGDLRAVAKALERSIWIRLGRKIVKSVKVRLTLPPMPIIEWYSHAARQPQYVGLKAMPAAQHVVLRSVHDSTIRATSKRRNASRVEGIRRLDAPIASNASQLPGRLPGTEISPSARGNLGRFLTHHDRHDRPVRKRARAGWPGPKGFGPAHTPAAFPKSCPQGEAPASWIRHRGRLRPGRLSCQGSRRSAAVWGSRQSSLFDRRVKPRFPRFPALPHRAGTIGRGTATPGRSG